MAQNTVVEGILTLFHSHESMTVSLVWRLAFTHSTFNKIFQLKYYTFFTFTVGLTSFVYCAGLNSNFIGYMRDDQGE